MTRRKQLKPRALTKHNTESNAVEEDNKTQPSSPNDDDQMQTDEIPKNSSTITNENQENDEPPNEANYESENSECESIGSYSSELYSSHSSISFPSSTHHSTSEMETNEIDVNDPIKKEKKDKNKFKGVSSYKCQFCEKSFPRLGYLKKHEQSHEDYMPFKCPVCLRLFKHKRSRDRHLKLHTGDRRYKCLFCDSAFSRSDHLKIHMKTHDSKKAFQCNFCNRGYNTAAALTSHMQNHKKQNELRERNESPYNYSMKSSESSTTSMTDKKRLELISSPKSVKSDSQCDLKNQIRCFYCTKTNFMSLDQLTHHINIMHNHRFMKDRKNRSEHEMSSPAQHYIACEFCLMKFTSSEKLIKHINLVHEDRMQGLNDEFSSPTKLNESSNCNNSSNNHNVQQHMSPNESNKKLANRYNSDEQPTDLSQRISKKIKMENYAVPKHFDTQINSSRTTAPPGTPDVFLCNQCNASLPSFELFRLHLKNHLEENYGSRSSEPFELNNAFYHSQKKFVCQQCRDVVFDNRYEYDQHVEQHYTEFLCQECDDTFTKNEDLQNHLLENHVRFKCTLCNENLESIMSLKLHFATRHSDKRCSACHDVFRNDRDFKNHIQSKHSAVDLIKCIFCRVTCSSELEMHFHFLSTHVKQFRCPACSESFHVEFLLDRHLQTHHSINESPVPPNNFSLDKEPSSLNLQNYHASLLESYREKFLLNRDPKVVDANFLHKMNPTIFPINSLHNQYPKNMNLNSLHESLSRVQSTIEEQQQSAQNMRVKNLYSLANDSLTKTCNNSSSAEGQVAGSFKIQNSSSSSVTANDKNNNKNASFKEKAETLMEAPAEKSSHIIHLNTKTGVSLKCAYCEAREDFKSRTELENHMKIQHNIAAKHKCSICDEILPSPAVLAEHKLQHCKVISGKCFHCSESIQDISDFKHHIQSHNQKNKNNLELPVHCICCHQLLTSDFEINLHAKFHTNTISTTATNDDKTCALCLSAIENTNMKKICNSCMMKHNFSLSKNQLQLCNLCKQSIEGDKFQDHLIEHAFENESITCVVCNSIFSTINGLKEHIREHKLAPLDFKEACSKCNARFLYSSELLHHLKEHEMVENQAKTIKQENDEPVIVKDIKDEEEDEDYIEIEKVPEN